MSFANTCVADDGLLGYFHFLF